MPVVSTGSHPLYELVPTHVDHMSDPPGTALRSLISMEKQHGCKLHEPQLEGILMILTKQEINNKCETQTIMIMFYFN